MPAKAQPARHFPAVDCGGCSSWLGAVQLERTAYHSLHSTTGRVMGARSSVYLGVEQTNQSLLMRVYMTLYEGKISEGLVQGNYRLFSSCKSSWSRREGATEANKACQAIEPAATDWLLSSSFFVPPKRSPSYCIRRCVDHPETHV